MTNTSHWHFMDSYCPFLFINTFKKFELHSVDTTLLKSASVQLCAVLAQVDVSIKIENREECFLRCSSNVTIDIVWSLFRDSQKNCP